MDAEEPLLKATYDPSNPSDWKNHLAAEPVKVRKTNFEIPREGSSSSFRSVFMHIGLEMKVLRQR